nr:type II toxin-antitoxin system RelE/ParE family toxin [Thiorhodococcus minor]
MLLRPLAQADIDDILAYCRAEGGPSLATAFAKQLEAALHTLATHAAIGSRRYADLLGIPGLRSWPIKRSAYLIFYVDEKEKIDIWRILHGRRDLAALLGNDDPEEGDLEETSVSE